MSREFVSEDDLARLLREFRPGARLAGSARLTGGSKKGVYRLHLADDSTLILYIWNEAENYWPPNDGVAGDPFTDATGAREFLACHAALTEAGVRVPELYALDLGRSRYPAGLALLQDAGRESLEDLMERDSAAAARPLAQLGEALLAMHSSTGVRYGKVSELAADGDPAASVNLATAAAAKPAEDVMLRRALRLLDLAAAMEPELAAVQAELTALVLALREAVQPRAGTASCTASLVPTTCCWIAPAIR